MATIRNSLVGLADVFHALSDPTRLHIVQTLLEGERCVCELTDHLEVAQSRLSFHLKTLKDAGLLQDRKEGRWVYYTLNADMLNDITDALSTIEKKARASRRCCD